MDGQTLRDWVHRFNASGPDGLTNAKGACRPRLLNDKRMRELSQIVETGPDWENDGVIRWRRIDLVRVIEDRFGVQCCERVVSDYLAQLDFSNISGRPQHPGQDAGVIEAFKMTSPIRSQLTSPICRGERRPRYGSGTRRASDRVSGIRN